MSASVAPYKNETDNAWAKKGHKAEDAYRTISEVADDLHVAQHVLRFWESKFKQIEPLKRAGGRRYYRREDVDLLKRIHYLLYTQGYTIKGVQKLLQKDKQLLQAVPALGGPVPVATLGATLASGFDARVTANTSTPPAVNQQVMADVAEASSSAESNDQLNLFAASDRVLMQDVLRRLKKIHDYLGA